MDLPHSDDAFVMAFPADEACDKVTTRVTSLSLVCFDHNDYSVPTAYGHQQVLVKGFVDQVVISSGAEEIARHPRSYEREDMIFEPRHYLALLEQKANALDQAAHLAGWQLPEEITRLRRLLEARLGKRGKREYVQILRLLEIFPVDLVRRAAADAHHWQAISFDAVKHLLLAEPSGKMGTRRMVCALVTVTSTESGTKSWPIAWRNRFPCARVRP